MLIPRSWNFFNLPRATFPLRLLPLALFTAVLALSPATSAADSAPEALGAAVTPENWEETTKRYAGNWTLFTFWGVYCEPCLEEMPHLIEVYRELHPKGLEIVAVNTDIQSEFESAAGILEKLEIPFPRLHKAPGNDTKFRQAIDPDYAANPFALLFDPAGKKVKVIAEAHDEAEWMNLLQPYLGDPTSTGNSVTAKPKKIIPTAGKGREAVGLDQGAASVVVETLDLNALVPGLTSDGGGFGGGGGPPANPFRLTRPKWNSDSAGAGWLELPFRSEVPGHLLLNSLQYEKIRGKGVALGEWKPSKKEFLYMEIRDETEQVLYTPGSILLNLQWPEAESGQEADLSLLFTFQGCTEGESGLCYPPDTYQLTGQLKSTPGGIELSGLKSERLDPFAPLPEPEVEVAAATESSTPEVGENRVVARPAKIYIPEDPALLAEKQSSGEGGISAFGFSGTFEDLVKESLWFTFVVAFIGGILTSFTPCVYPMIPATVAIFGAKEVRSKAQALALAATYIMGVALSYSSLGLIAAAVGSVFGQAMENPWVISVVALFYIILALSMLDVFVFYLPSSWVTAATKVNRKGFTGAFLMGLVSSVVFAPCGEPILLSILLFVAKTQSFFLGFWWLFVYAWGIGLLFFVIAVFSSSLQYLPKAGVWMVAVKDFFGLLLLGLALYWLSFVIPPIWLYSLAVLYFLGTATFIHYKNDGLTGWPRATLSFTALALLLAATLPLQKVAISQGWLPSAPLQGAIAGNDLNTPTVAEHETWRTDQPLAALERARVAGKPAMVDFRTNVCAKCDELEHYTFSDPKVLEALSGFEKIQVNLSEPSEEGRKLQRTNRVQVVPVIDFYDSQGNLLLDKRIPDFIEAERFIEHIRDIS